MLPLPNLDDRTFEQMIRRAREMIPGLLADWTDENAHDPGITIIELLAWLSEMQQFQLNQVTKKNEYKFLKLLGIHLLPQKPARTYVTVQGVKEEIVLPQGTRLSANGITFETEQEFPLFPNQLEKILVRTELETNDYSNLRLHEGVSFFAFGEEARAGSKLFIGFAAPLPVNQQITLLVKLFEEYAVPLGARITEESFFSPSAKVSWHYYGWSTTGEEEQQNWLPLEQTKDETYQLSQSGQFSFRIPSALSPMNIYPANDKPRYWLCCTLEEAGYENPPRIDGIYLHTVPVVQQESLSVMLSYTSTGFPEQEIVVSHALALRGQIYVQVRGQDGYWHEVQEVNDQFVQEKPSMTFQVFKGEVEVRILLSLGSQVLPQDVQDNIRVILVAPSFQHRRWLGRSNGTPGLRIDVHDLALFPETFHLQVGRLTADGQEMVWEDWQRVDDFDSSNADDPHYMYLAETGEIIFGNNELGLTPEQAAKPNICVLQCQVGGGERGNVQNKQITTWLDELPKLSELAEVFNPYRAAGGQDRERLEDAKVRLGQLWNEQKRAVTAQDFEQLAKQAPGVRIAKVKALPLYEAGMRDYPRQKIPGKITVVVVPYGQSQMPLPSQGFLQTVHRFLEPYRLITTELQVIPPEYIKVTVHATIVVDDQMKDGESINRILYQYLSPLPTEATEGWEFGHSVFKEDIYGILSKIPGVIYILDFWLGVQGKGAKKEIDGNITLPPHGLVYSGLHQIELVSKWDI